MYVIVSFAAQVQISLQGNSYMIDLNDVFYDQKALPYVIFVDFGQATRKEKNVGHIPSVIIFL